MWSILQVYYDNRTELFNAYKSVMPSVNIVNINVVFIISTAKIHYHDCITSYDAPDIIVANFLDKLHVQTHTHVCPFI